MKTNPTDSSPNAPVRLTPAVERVLEWHRARLGATSAERRGDLSSHGAVAREGRAGNDGRHVSESAVR